MAIEQARSTSRGATFERYVEEMRAAWAAGQDESLPRRGQALLEKLLREAPDDEPWAVELVRDQARARPLHRDPDYGFVQMGHIMHPGPGPGTTPHDHGPCWVLYGVFRGAIDVTTFRRTDDGSVPGKARLEKIETVRLSPGVVRPYLVGDIHLQQPVDPNGSIVLRFLSYDLDQVDRLGYDLDSGAIVPIPAAR
jgi:predicted metal-dependent enzyme (double-stranded beta helix superfamily)